MCGICGYVNLDKKPIHHSGIIEDMTRSLIHRGPDDEGFYVKDNIALGMRRLTVIDLITGHQPIHNEDAGVWVILNGEIYNFIELRESLIKSGHTFYTNSDTEILVHLYEDFGKDCVKKIEGMFSFCVYDKRENVLFFARDRLGEKPFYYYYDEKIFVFGSEIKAILKHPGVKKQIDTLSLNKFFSYGYIPSPSSIFRNIRKLEAAHILTLSLNKSQICNIEKYWSQSFSQKIISNEKEILNDIREKLKQSVQSRLVSDVPIGALLSGGIDSSLVVLMMSELLESRQIKTFSIGFKEKEFDESSYAQIIARQFNTDHKEKIVSAKDALNVLPEIFDKLDEPMCDPSLIPTYLVNKFASQHVKVALSGDGGDELFAGYPKYIVFKILSLFEFFPKRTKDFGNRFIKFLFKNSNDHRVSRFIETLKYPLFMRNQLWVSNFLPYELNELLKDDFQAPDGEEVLLDDLNKYFSLFNGATSLDRAFFFDTIMNLQDYYLVKMDRASMMNSLEVRTPFLHHKLVEFASSIPASLKTKMFETKSLLKKVASINMSKNFVYRRKMGFSIPLAQWFKNELKDKVEDLRDKSIFFESSYVNKIIDDHFNGVRNNTGKIWPLIVFNEWHSRWIS